jgi:hypothetical protein
MLTTAAFAVAPVKLAPRSARIATHRKLLNEKNELAITKPLKKKRKRSDPSDEIDWTTLSPLRTRNRVGPVPVFET